MNTYLGTIYEYQNNITYDIMNINYVNIKLTYATELDNIFNFVIY